MNKTAITLASGETVDVAIELEQEEDGRWIADAPDVPGAMVYSGTKEGAVHDVIELVKRVFAEAPDPIPMEPIPSSLGEARARAAQIERAIESETAAKTATTQAAIGVLMRESRHGIQIPPADVDRAFVRIGVRMSDSLDAVAQLVVRDIVLRVYVNGEPKIKTPIGFLPAQQSIDAQGATTWALRPLMMPIGIPAGAAAAVELEAYATLPANGLGFVVYADVWTARPEPRCYYEPEPKQ